jgi:hypothetical protein
MYDKKIKDAFWSTFGKYMSLTPSATGEKINWINYKTGIKHLAFKIDADDRSVKIAIECSNPSQETRERLAAQLMRDKQLLADYTGEGWIFDMTAGNEMAVTGFRCYKTLTGPNIYLRQDWPEIISFLKKNLLGLDAFWHEQKELYSMING